MADENLRDQFVTVSNLARMLAKDRSFVCEIGLDEFSSLEIVEKLKLVIGFVLAMYNTAKSIFRSAKYQTLDDKFVELIYSRVCLIPEIMERGQEPRDYAERCYYLHRMKMGSEESEKNWEEMSLYEQFFEVCVCVFLEEMKLDSPDLHLMMPEFERISSRSILACTFKGVFSHIKWELEDICTQVEPKQKVVLSPKKTHGPDSRLKEYPLLYLYFDDFDEISIAGNKGYFEVARHDSDIRSCRFSPEEIMRDENLFLELYKNNLVRLRLWDGTELIRSEEELYWDEVKHPGKLASRFGFPDNRNVPDLAGQQEGYRKDMARIAEMVEAIKSRYGLTDSDIESKNSNDTVITTAKKPWVAAILCFFFGPFGMFYFGWRPAIASLIMFGSAQIFFTIYLVKICEPTPWIIPSLVFIWAYIGWGHAKGWNSQATKWQSDKFASFNFGVLSTLYLIWLNVLISIPVALLFGLIDAYTEADFAIRDILLFGSLTGLIWLFVWVVWFWLGRMVLVSWYRRLGLGAPFLRRQKLSSLRSARCV